MTTEHKTVRQLESELDDMRAEMGDSSTWGPIDGDWYNEMQRRLAYSRKLLEILHARDDRPDPRPPGRPAPRPVARGNVIDLASRRAA